MGEMQMEMAANQMRWFLRQVGYFEALPQPWFLHREVVYANVAARLGPRRRLAASCHCDLQAALRQDSRLSETDDPLVYPRPSSETTG